MNGGVGFVFTPDDPYCGIDLDDCIDPDTGETRLGVDDVIDTLGSYAEISPSGAGIKAIVCATKPGNKCVTKDTTWGGRFEMFDQEKFFALPSRGYRDAPLQEAQEAIDALYGEFFREDRPKVGRAGDHRSRGQKQALSGDQAISTGRHTGHDHPLMGHRGRV